MKSEEEIERLSGNNAVKAAETLAARQRLGCAALIDHYAIVKMDWFTRKESQQC
jgi:hypothetical protein